MFTVHILIEGRDILLGVFRNEDIMKGVLKGMTHVEPRSVYTLNETTFLVTYSLGILADDIGSAIEKIDKWLGKPVEIMCNEVTAAQLPQVLELACCTTGVKSIVFNTGLDEILSLPSVIVDTKAMQVAQLCSQGHQGPHFLTDYQAYHDFLFLSKKKTLSAVASFYFRCQKKLYQTGGKGCYKQIMCG